MRWDKLSMKDRSELISLFVKNGITDLNQMYNLYEDGGEVSSVVNNNLYRENQEEPIYRYLTQRKRLSHNQAVSLMGNFAVESYLNNDIKQKKGPARGLGQFEGQRYIDASQYPYIYEFGSNLDPSTQGVIDYIVDKGINSHKSGEWRHGKGYSTANNARLAFKDKSDEDIEVLTTLLQNNYFRPSKPHTKRRLEMSHYYDDKFKKENNNFSIPFPILDHNK